MTARIYVQIPAYRDRELLPTLRDLMRTAHKPESLRVTVAWQHDETEARLEPALRQWSNVELITIPARSSQGCNWARNLLQRDWQGEPYTLFLDSHHRFAAGWDDAVVGMHEERRRAGFAKPIISGYLPPYDPRNDPAGRTLGLFAITVRERVQGMVFRLVGDPVPRWQELTTPMPTRFVSLHFLFADGAFNREIAFDPSIYFFADEVAIALRAYTSGYDLFAPHRVLGWHLYDRATRITHWADHDDWHARNEASRRRLGALFRGEVTDAYGLGNSRSLADYESFAGTKLLLDRAP